MGWGRGIVRARISFRLTREMAKGHGRRPSVKGVEGGKEEVIKLREWAYIYNGRESIRAQQSGPRMIMAINLDAIPSRGAGKSKMS